MDKAIEDAKAANTGLRRSTEVWARIFQSHGSKTWVVGGCAVFVFVLGVIARTLQRDVNLGYLYAIPLTVAAGFLRRWQILVMAFFSALLLEMGSSSPWSPDFAARIATITVAFGATGLFVKELTRNQQFALERSRHLEARQRLEDQLRHAQRLEAVGRLAGGVAHDFNNVLCVIMAYSDSVLKKMGTNFPFRKDVEQIRTAADRGARLTRQLLVFSRRQKIEPAPLNLNEVVSRIADMMLRLIGQDIDLELKLQPRLKRVMADLGLIEQMVMNLAVNSRDAMPSGGRLVITTAAVEISRANAPLSDMTAGSYVTLTVSDTGTGMDVDAQEHLFEPFFTTKERGKGTGLGLSMVYGIVKESNGHITFTSERGRGTTFTIYLPAVDGAEEPREAPAPANAPSGLSSEAGRVLLVEDYAPIRSLTAELLRNSGYTVIEAQDAAEAISLAGQQRQAFDLLLTDVAMPKMSGQELAKRLTSEWPAMPVLFMTGYADDVLGQRPTLPAGAALLEKPFVPDSLLEAVRGVLEAAPRARVSGVGGSLCDSAQTL
ncbi:MAG TPA: ATP-binding protein [Bryobacteraceae bacterium]|nr:ATP-binding protein [Bryobacteraceae bacterium]